MGEDGTDYRPGLNQRTPLGERLGEALRSARGFDLAVAYAKSSGVGELLRSDVPRPSRAVVGLGFGLTDPHAVEQLEGSGVEVRAVAHPTDLETSQFHPKLYLVTRPSELVVFSGSSNLTAGGLRHNVEQYEELAFPDPSRDSDAQRERFEELWGYGMALGDLRRAGEWEAYRQRARDRRRLEVEDRRRLLHLHATAGRLVGRLAQRETRRAPAYLGITHPDWWEQQLAQRAVADRALFWRRGTTDFKALAAGGIFFHLVPAPSGVEEERAVQGFSVYPNDYDVTTVEDAWRRYGELLGVRSVGQIYDRLGIESGRLIGVIHLEQVTELDRPVMLEELRGRGVPFQKNIQSGRTLTLEEVAVIFELGGLDLDTPSDVGGTGTATL